MNKKAVSEVVVAILMILLVIAVIGILWAVLLRFVGSGAEQIELGISTIDLEIVSAQYGPENLEVKITRNSGEGDLSKINIILKDEQGESFTYTSSESLNIFETKPILIPVSDITENIGKIAEVSVLPVVTSSKGKDLLGKVVDEYDFTWQVHVLDDIESIDGWSTQYLNNGGLKTECKICPSSYGGTYLATTTDAGRIQSINDFGNLTAFSKDSDYLEFWLYISDVSGFTLGQIELGNDLDSREYYWTQTNLPLLVDDWNKISLKMGDAVKDNVDWSGVTTPVDHFRIYFIHKTETSSAYEVYIDGLQMVYT